MDFLIQVFPLIVYIPSGQGRYTSTEPGKSSIYCFMLQLLVLRSLWKNKTVRHARNTVTDRNTLKLVRYIL